MKTATRSADKRPKKEASPRLNFEYCECGCKGFYAHVGGLHFWMDVHIDGPKKGLVSLHDGHGRLLSAHIKDFKSAKEAEEEAGRRVQAAIGKMQKALKGK